MARFPPCLALATALLSFHPPAAATVPPTELSALSDFYFSTGGNTSWVRKEGWRTLEDEGTPTDPCNGTWYGVGCDAANTHVESLDLVS